MKRKELISIILRGALRSNRLYSEWSGGAWIRDSGVEGFMVSQIARSIQKLRPGGLLTMEEPFSEMIENCGKKPRGRRSCTLSDGNRVDI